MAYEILCAVLEIRASLNYIYKLNGTHFKKEVDEQRDLGVIINNRLTPSSHIQNIRSKASQRLFMIKRCFTGLTKAKLSTLYTNRAAYYPTGSLLEYASIIWNPWSRKDISALDSVQRKCDKLCSLLRRYHLSLCVRGDIDLTWLRHTSLSTINTRRIHNVCSLYHTGSYVVIKTRYSNRLQELIYRSSFSVIVLWIPGIYYRDNWSRYCGFKPSGEDWCESCHLAKTTYRPGNQVSNHDLWMYCNGRYEHIVAVGTRPRN